MPLTDLEVIRYATRTIRLVRNEADFFAETAAQPSPAAVWLGDRRRTTESSYRHELRLLAETLQKAAVQLETDLLPPVGANTEPGREPDGGDRDRR